MNGGPSDDSSALKADHTPEAIRTRLKAGSRQLYLRDLIYGAVDGAVTTLAVVSGAAGAQLSSGIVIVLGVANLIADGFSMAASNYLGIRAEQQLRDRAWQTEARHIEDYPEGEREESRQILANKGFEDADLQQAVQLITSDRRRWIELMITEEYGLSMNGTAPLPAATATFVAFVVVGCVPLLPFILQYAAPNAADNPFAWSGILTAAAFFGVGAAKSVVVEQKWYWSGLETLFVGGSAAILAYVIGRLLGNFA